MRVTVSPTLTWPVGAHVHSEGIHGDAADHGVAAAVDEHLAAVAQGSEHAVAVAEGHQGHVGGRGGRKVWP